MRDEDAPYPCVFCHGPLLDPEEAIHRIHGVCWDEMNRIMHEWDEDTIVALYKEPHHHES